MPFRIDTEAAPGVLVGVHSLRAPEFLATFFGTGDHKPVQRKVNRALSIYGQISGLVLELP